VIRSNGYDSPEIHPKTGTPEEKRKEHEKAILARDYFIPIVLGKYVYLDCEKSDMYGRTLAYIYFNKQDCIDGRIDKSVNQQMVKSGHGWPYEGGNKDEAKKAAHVEFDTE